jgi:predicted PurR-regulated permease PerM
MILKSHLLSMIIYAFFVCIVLAIIRRRERKAQIRYFISLFLIMVAGALLFGWFMFLFIP